MLSLEELIAFDKAHTRWSGTSLQEKPLLYALTLLFRPERMIEIGVRGAHSTAWIALAMEHAGRGHLWGVDKWVSPNSSFQQCYPAAIKRLDQLKLSHRVTLVREDSVAFLRAQPDNSAEIVGVDGGHSYAQTMADISQARRVASMLIYVHDATNIEDVNRACKDIGGGVWVYGAHPTEARGYWLLNTGPAPGIEHK